MRVLRVLVAVVLLGFPVRSGRLGAATVTTIYDFTNGVDGAYPEAGLTQGTDGSFYGTTSYGGTNGDSTLGTVFKIASTGTQTTLYVFSGGSDGKNPIGPLVHGSDSNYYGTTSAGGLYGYGTVFKITGAGSLTLLHSFNGSDGANPYAGLIQGSDGDFYGTTLFGGTNHNSTSVGDGTMVLA